MINVDLLEHDGEATSTQQPNPEVLLWDNSDIGEITSMISSFLSTTLFLHVNKLVSATEAKLWLVPRIDSRTMTTHRHAPETSFANFTADEMPAFMSHARALWQVAYRNPNQQQPTRPASILEQGPAVRFLGHSSVLSGLAHLQQTIHQLGKVWWSKFILLMQRLSPSFDAHSSD